MQLSRTLVLSEVLRLGQEPKRSIPTILPAASWLRARAALWTSAMNGTARGEPSEFRMR
jgi:hypothetical protein